MSLPLPVIDISPDGSYAVLKDVYHVSAWPFYVWIDAGFVYDGASIPELLRPCIGGQWDPRRLPAATVHDWLYASHVLPKWLADLVFLWLLVLHGHGLWRSLADWWAVSRFGHAAWYSHDRAEQSLTRSIGRIDILLPNQKMKGNS